MNKVHYLNRTNAPGGGDDGEPPMNDLTARVERLERNVGDIKVILARMEGKFEAMDAKLDTFATKADLSDTKASLIQWGVGTVIAAGALVFAIMRFLPA